MTASKAITPLPNAYRPSGRVGMTQRKIIHRVK